MTVEKEGFFLFYYVFLFIFSICSKFGFINVFGSGVAINSVCEKNSSGKPDAVVRGCSAK